MVSDDDERNLMKYIKPVSEYKTLEKRSKNNPYFLRRCLNYIIKAKKKKKSKSNATIIFNYRDGGNRKTLRAEVVKKTTCPFCLMLCGGMEGLRLHLISSHDVFKYDFYGAEKDHGPEVDVSLKPDAFKFGVQILDSKDNQWIPFTFRSKRRRPRQRDGSNNMKRINVRFSELDINQALHPHDTENESTHMNVDSVSSPPRAHPLETTSQVLTTTQPEIAQSSEMNVDIVSSPPRAHPWETTSQVVTTTQPEIAQSSEMNVDSVSSPPRAHHSETTSQVLTITQPEVAQSSEPEVPHVNRRKKLLAERSKAKGIERLKSRQFYHSQTMQPMTFEKVMAGEDSENEDDDDALDLHERLRLQGIKGVSNEEKRYMYLWNIFKRRQRVIADGHVPWACKEFSKLHKEELKGHSFNWWWKQFLIKLWDYGLVCAKTINECNTIIQNSDEAGPSTSQGAANANTLQLMEIDTEQQ